MARSKTRTYGRENSETTGFHIPAFTTHTPFEVECTGFIFRFCPTFLEFRIKQKRVFDQHPTSGRKHGFYFFRFWFEDFRISYQKPIFSNPTPSQVENMGVIFSFLSGVFRISYQKNVFSTQYIEAIFRGMCEYLFIKLGMKTKQKTSSLGYFRPKSANFIDNTKIDSF